MLSQRINALLPQTQCTKCGYQGCEPYAQAIASEGAAINRCPPGGDEGIVALANLLERPVVALDRECGTHQPLQVAVIDEQFCIGCTLCIQACPVDAIIGASKLMHTVLPEQCTGCDLCVAPLPGGLHFNGASQTSQKMDVSRRDTRTRSVRGAAKTSGAAA